MIENIEAITGEASGDDKKIKDMVITAVMSIREQWNRNNRGHKGYRNNCTNDGDRSETQRPRQQQRYMEPSNRNQENNGDVNQNDNEYQYKRRNEQRNLNQ
ncbi:hypothetical protein DPMN_140259 [Dreissena polymorpha]|uniref:Uncharacterized protein n=1 Tax=Dreissena polymorpha TaxID=45954 RepID=A0A9D4GAM6_DREPO|nr:hypothetical protein DPMN_140259 [Dreissena polymorpha]